MKSNRRQHVLLGMLLILVVGASACSRRTDEQIASDVQAKINSDATIASKQIEVQSDKGVVSLAGPVASAAERDAAARDAAQVDGVKTVVNNLEVSPLAAKVAARRAARGEKPGALRSVNIPEGTPIIIRMIDSIDSDKNKSGDTFRASLDEPITVGDKVVVPKNADIEGRVVEVQSAGHFKGRSDIGLELMKLTVNGESYELNTDQFSRQGASRGTRTAETIGGGAALGAVIGAIAGHGKGAAIGAAAGAGAGTAVQAMTKGQQVHIPSETQMTFHLKVPLTVVPSSRSQRTGGSK